MVGGLLGSVATLLVLTGPGFRSNTFLYLRALSVSDLLYLLAALGWLYEIFSQAKHIAL